MRTKSVSIMAPILFFFSVLSLIFLSPQTVQAEISIKSHLKLSNVEYIVIRYWQNGELLNKSVEKRITDKKALASLLEELDKLPARGPGRRAKLDSNSPEYRIEFYKKGKKLGFLRIKSGMLDSPGTDGWDFYQPGADHKVVDLVISLFNKP